VDELIVGFIKKKFYHVDINIDFKQMKGNISDIYRIRKGDIRVIVKIANSEIIIEAIVENIGYRGNIYKN
jgi:mRNA interferase RelE/StbE